jgi:transglutaminase-like putative cysteine protease
VLSLVPGAVPAMLQGLPDGVDGIRATLKLMTNVAAKYKKDIGIVTLARQLIATAPGTANAKNNSDFVRLIQHFVRDQIRYVRDIRNTEMLQTPIRTLQIRTGDCDDKATLVSSLLESIGLQTRFVALAFNDGPYSHVLAEVRLGTSWIPLETIIDGVEPGWFPPVKPTTDGSSYVTDYMTARV